MIDEYKPTGDPKRRREYEDKANRLFTNIGNKTGRDRGDRQGQDAKAGRKPRCLALSTGEEVPDVSESTLARMVPVEIDTGGIVLERLKVAQAAASQGPHEQAMAGYVRWLAGRMAGMAQEIDAIKSEAAGRLAGMDLHGRTPEAIGDLFAGAIMLLNYAVLAGACTAEEALTVRSRVWSALSESAAGQLDEQKAERPSRRSIEGMRAYIAAGNGHVINSDGSAPADAWRWGWRYVDGAFQPRGECVGVLQGLPPGAAAEVQEIYFDPDLYYNAATRAVGHLGVGRRALVKRLREDGQLVRWDDKRDKNTVRVGKDRRSMLAMLASYFASDIEEPKTYAKAQEVL